MSKSERRALYVAVAKRSRSCGADAHVPRDASERSEEEKMVLAREIHDEFGQVLTALKMDLAYVRRKLEDDPSKPVYIMTEPGVGYYMVR